MYQHPSSRIRDGDISPDGPTLMPWATSRWLIRVFTFHHTVAASFIARAVLDQRFNAKKHSKTKNLWNVRVWQPITVCCLLPLIYFVLKALSRISTHVSRAYMCAAQKCSSAATQSGMLPCLYAALCMLGCSVLCTHQWFQDCIVLLVQSQMPIRPAAHQAVAPYSMQTQARTTVYKRLEWF